MTEIADELAAIIEARVGQTVCCGKYRIDGVLGVGGMASVYAGVHRNGRRVAMKFLHPEYSRRSDIRKRFIREALAANAVTHAGVVAVIDDDVAEDGAAFLVMERLEGKTLEALWEELGHRLPARAVLAIGRDLCLVLAAAHRARIVHRDIKPENIFLTSDGVLKVLDFGLAQLRDAARPKDTHTGMVFGTPAFMPPEQASGKTSEIDARTDLWAVGATMFTLLSGEMVHEGETAQHFVMLAATESARSLGAVLQDAHPSLVQLIDRALTRDKEMRWQSADAMHDAIRGASQLLFGEADIPLPRPDELAQFRASLRIETYSKADSDEPTLDKKKRAPTDNTLQDERTRTAHTTVTERTGPVDGDSSAPPTQPKLKAIVGGGSDTPTEQTTPDKLPTQIREIPEPPDSEQSGDSAAVMRKRASWSDLRRAIGQNRATPPLRGPDSAPLQHEPQLSSTRGMQGQTASIAPASLRSTPPAPTPVSVPAFAMPAGLQRYPAPLPSAPNGKTGEPTNRRRSNPYLPIVLVAVFVGLTPIAAHFLARSGGDALSRAPRSEPGALETATPPFTATVAQPVFAAASSTAPAVSVDAGTAHAIIATNATALHVPRLAPAIPHASASASTITMPSAHAPDRCSPPYDLDRAGIKHWKLECVEP